MNNVNAQQFSIRASIDSLELRAVIDARGAALSGLWFGEQEIAGDPNLAGFESRYIGSTLAPWPNRIAAARWRHAGSVLSFELNEPDKNNALHGLVFDVQWQLREKTNDTVRLGYALEPSAGYPFQLDIEVSYQLMATGLTVSTRVENQTAERAPFGLAFHPYFKVLDGDAQLETSFTSFLETDDNLIPTGQTLPLSRAGLSDDAQLDRILAIDARLDHCLSKPRAGEIFTRIRSALGTTTIWQQPEFGYCMVYSGTVGDRDRPGYLAIEPQTMPADAFNTGQDLLWIEPQASVDYRWGVSFAR